MKDLKQLRMEINNIDDSISKLYIDRMEVVKEVLEFKLKNNLDVFDVDREKEVLDNNTSKMPDTIQAYARSFYQGMMDSSKDYQWSLMNQKKDNLLVEFNCITLLFSSDYLIRILQILENHNIIIKSISTIDDSYQIIIHNDEIIMDIIEIISAYCTTLEIAGN